MSKLLLIDGNNIGYACQHAGGSLHCNGRPTKAIYHMIRSLRSLKAMYPDYRHVVLWDGRAQWRFDILPTYKAGRNKSASGAKAHEEYIAQKPIIIDFIKALGLMQMRSPDAEADDLAGYFATKAAGNGDSVVLISGDQDWLQLVGPTVMWHDVIRDKRVTEGNFAEKTGYPTQEMFLAAKAMEGDASDKITPIGGFGEKMAYKFLLEYGSVDNFLQLAKEGKLPTKLPAALVRMRDNIAPKPKKSRKTGEMIEYAPTVDAFRRNMNLMDLRMSKPKFKEKPVVTKGEFDKKVIAQLCRENGFATILNTLETWAKPFEGRT